MSTGKTKKSAAATSKDTAVEVIAAQKSSTPMLTQDDIPAFLQKVEAAIRKISTGIPTTEKKTGAFPGYGKIQDINSVQSLIEMYAGVEAREEAYKKAAASIVPEQFKAPALTIAGFAPNTWKEEIKERVGVLSHKREMDRLTKMKQALEERMSEEAKLQKTLDEIGASFANMDLE